MNALVTGGAGFLGLYITEQLRARGDSVTVFCRTHSARVDDVGAGWIAGDVRDPAAVERACRDRDAVFHVAAIPGVWGPWKRYYEVNTLGTKNVIEGCRRHGVPKLIYTSSPSVVHDGTSQENADETCPYPDPSHYLCHYPHTKALAEQAVLEANGSGGLATVALRPHLIWGPRDNHLVPRLLQRARSGRLRRVGEGTNRISMTYVENAAAAHLQAADVLADGSPVAGQVYFINEPEPVNLWQWIDELLGLAGLPPVSRQISAKTARRLGAVMEAAYWLFRLPGEPPMTRFVADELSTSHWYSIEKARRDFGYEPIVPVEEGMQRLAADLRGEPSTSGRHS